MSLLKVNNITDLGDDPVLTDGVLDVTPPAILQVVQTAKLDAFSTTSTSFTDVTGLSATITPSSASSKVLVIMNAKVGNTANTSFAYTLLLRDGSAIYSATADAVQAQHFSPAGDTIVTHDAVVLDNPATTSAVTYKVQMKTNTATAYLNRNQYIASGITGSSITLMEVAG